jgi:hypothetical protein
LVALQRRTSIESNEAGIARQLLRELQWPECCQNLELGLEKSLAIITARWGKPSAHFVAPTLAPTTFITTVIMATMPPSTHSMATGYATLSRSPTTAFLTSSTSGNAMDLVFRQPKIGRLFAQLQSFLPSSPTAGELTTPHFPTFSYSGSISTGCHWPWGYAICFRRLSISKTSRVGVSQ